MGLKEILEDRVSQNNTLDQNVIDWLNEKAGDIISLASQHLKYVSQVFNEFDNHDAKHSEKVLEIIENLLGDNAKNLSSYDLFFLIAVSYLHDCGMAVSDYEMEVLKIVESKLDGQKLMTLEEAKLKIRSKRRTIYGTRSRGFTGDIRNWLFVPTDEESLITYFAILLIDYQKYRIGKTKEIESVHGKAKTKKNNELRLDYLRITHHERIEKYLKNWADTKFADFPNSGMASGLVNDIAKCCKAHGMDAAFLQGNEFRDKTKVQYCGGETCNLQFVAIMLRLGDIIHYSNDRAHPVLRSLHHFSSEYSYTQWCIKANGLNFDVSDGKVSCIANCQSPKDYYDLWAYVDNIDNELALYNSISSKWNDFPKEGSPKISINEKVDRKNIRHNQSFVPALGRKFTLDQKKVLELLTGTKLYTNEYACLRELYQNSLDACRCQISRNNTGIEGRIEFGLKNSPDGSKYVYCLDNGKGMTKDIIERFMLHIGSSYYDSPEFYLLTAETGAKFKPTSQFGIGMLSCFMIGNKIEITTHEGGSAAVSCVMVEKPSEYFYYKSTPIEEDVQLIHRYGSSGTLVKVFLNEKYQSLLNDNPLEDYAYLLWYNGYNIPFSENEKWFHHLYNILNDFIQIVPDHINVFISLKGYNARRRSIRNSVKIYNKPLALINELQPYVHTNSIYEDDFFLFGQLMNSDNLIVSARNDELECRIIIELGIDVFGGNIRMNGVGRCCVDGLAINIPYHDNYSLTSRLLGLGVLNFIGHKRPQLSVNRDDIIDASLEKYDQAAGLLLEELINKAIYEICDYLENKKKTIPPRSYLYNEIWYRFFKKFDFCIALLYKCLKNNEVIHNMMMPFQEINVSFGDFFINDTIIKRKEIRSVRTYSLMQLLLLRLLEATDISFNNNNELLVTGHEGIPSSVPETKRLDVFDYYFNPSGYNSFWKDYDIVQFAKLRFISDEIKTKIDEVYGNTINNYIESDRYFYLKKVVIKKLFSERRKRKFKKNEPYSISQNTTINFIDSLGLYKIGNFIYDLIGGNLIMDLMPRHNPLIQYSGLTLLLHNKSLLLLEMNRDNNSRKLCFALRGKCSRQKLLDSIPDDWKQRINNVQFIDGTIFYRNSSNSYIANVDSCSNNNCVEKPATEK